MTNETHKIDETNETNETNEIETEDDNPKFGRLLIILFLAVVFVGFLTWLMETQFPDFGW